MDVVNLSRSRRFLRERPVRSTLFDRPRLVCDLLCLESGQEETRRGLDASDSLFLLLEGKGRVRVGSQVEELEEMDAVLVPPGVEQHIENTGAGRLVAMVTVTPKPSRSGEVRMPVQQRPWRQPRGFDGPRQEERASTPAEGRDSAPPRARPGGRPPRPTGDRAARPGGYRGGPRRDDERSDRPARPGGYRGGPRRDDERSARPARPGGYRGGPRRDDERSDRPARGSTGARPPRPGDEEKGPVWFPKTKPPGGHPAGRPRRDRDTGPSDRSGARASGPPRDGKKTGQARRASRGQGPQSGRREPGRSGPRTSGRRQSP